MIDEFKKQLLQKNQQQEKNKLKERGLCLPETSTVK